MYERHDSIFKQLFNPVDNEVTISSHAKIVKIDSQGRVLTGILVGKSIAIPLSAIKDTDESVRSIVEANLAELNLPLFQSAPETACRLLGTPLNSHTGGFYSDSSAFGSINSVHIHAEKEFNSQEEFLENFTEIFESKGLKITVSESL